MADKDDKKPASFRKSSDEDKSATANVGAASDDKADETAKVDVDSDKSADEKPAAEATPEIPAAGSQNEALKRLIEKQTPSF